MFLNRYRGFLKDGGVVRLKTDNRELYEYTKEIVEYNGLEVLSATTDLYKDFADSEILGIKTHYEKIFSQQGLPINYLEFKLKKEREILLPNRGS